MIYNLGKGTLFTGSRKLPRCKSKRIRKKWDKKYGFRISGLNFIIPKAEISKHVPLLKCTTHTFTLDELNKEDLKLLMETK